MDYDIRLNWFHVTCITLTTNLHCPFLCHIHVCSISMIVFTCALLYCSISYSNAGPVHPFPFNFLRVCFRKFDCITHMYFNCSHRAMFIVHFIYYSYYNIHRVYVMGHQNKLWTPKIPQRRDCTPDSKIICFTTIRTTLHSCTKL